MSMTAIAFLVLFIGGASGALLVDPAYGIFMYVLGYFLTPKSRWWWSDLPDLRFAFLISIITMVGFLIRHKKYSEKING